MVSDYEKGLWNGELLTLTAVAAVPLILAVWLGNRIHSRIDQTLFNRLTYGLLLLAGAMILL